MTRDNDRRQEIMIGDWLVWEINEENTQRKLLSESDWYLRELLK